MTRDDDRNAAEPAAGDDAWIRAQLASLPDPVMPEGVDARLRQLIRQDAGKLSSDQAPNPEADAPRRSTRWLSLAAAAAAVVILGVVVTGLLNSDGSTDPVVMAAGVQPVATNTSYTRENIEDEVRTHLAALRSQQRVGQAVSQQVRQNTFTADTQSIDGCLSALNPRTGQVHLLDMADYQGEPSGIVVFRSDDQMQVFVVAPTCNREDPRVRLRLQSPIAAD